jgi:YjbE family integral membrane protein
METVYSELIALAQVIVIDLVLAGDNAIVVGLAASRVAPELRAKVIFWGIAGAVVLRIAFAALTVQILAIVGLTLAGGILLLWVSWKMYREMRHAPRTASAGAAVTEARGGTTATLGFRGALVQIIAADVSMSLDNVLAGLGIAVVLMALAANYVAKLLARFPWITWIGLLIILYVAVDMMWRGALELACNYGPVPVCSDGMIATVGELLR